MNILKKLIVSSSLLLIISAFAVSDTYRIFHLRGTVDLPDSVVYLHKISPSGIDLIDTLYTDSKGQFTYDGEETELRLYYLTFGSVRPPGVPLLLGEPSSKRGLKIELSVQNKSYFPHNIEGGNFSASMHELHSIYTGYDELIEEFVLKINTDTVVYTDAEKIALRSQYDSIMSKRRSDIERFIDRNPASPILYYAVRFLFAKPEPVLVMKALEKMRVDMPESEYTKELEKIRESFGPVIEGMKAPDIALLSSTGDTVKLSSLKGKVVLVDFWASWCGPCRRENPNVVKMYEKYKDQGFEIYGVSLDRERNSWLAAIEKDGLGWVHVSDLRGWSSVAAKAYGVHSIPETFLLDREGRIYKIGLRGQELEKALEQLL